MEGVISYNGSSWADQWDTTAPTSATDNSGATAKYKQKVGGGLEKDQICGVDGDEEGETRNLYGDSVDQR
ncbi:hypothetical protein GQ457_18G003500 [Hibiscus cannabinus]